MISFTTGEKQVVVASSIIDSEGQLVGMLGLSIGWKRIESLTKALIDRQFMSVEEQPKIMLVSGDGTY